MTIPPVSVRQVRPCEVCEFLEFTPYMVQKCKIGVFKMCRMRGKTHCVYNITCDELKELIDQHNATENTVENYK